ncbi:MAG: globin [Gemmatimonadota bacterium]
MRTAPSDKQILLAQASYDRCQQAPGFYRRFYERFLASAPEIPGYFSNTKFDKQDRLLEHGILSLLIYARRGNPALLARIAERHGPNGLSIPARLFPGFVTSFLATVQECDPGCDQATLDAWAAALEPGIALISGSA